MFLPSPANAVPEYRVAARGTSEELLPGFQVVTHRLR